MQVGQFLIVFCQFLLCRFFSYSVPSFSSSFYGVLPSYFHNHPSSPSSQGPIVLGRKQKALQKTRSADFNPDFLFTEKEGMYDGSWAMADVMSQLKKKVRLTVIGSSRPWAFKDEQWITGSNPDLTVFCHLLPFGRYWNSFGIM